MRLVPRTAGLTALVASFVLVGCGRPQASPQNLHLISSLRTAASTRNPGLLEQNATLIEQRREAGEVGDAEYRTFQKILELARAGNWESAERETIAFQKSHPPDHRADPGASRTARSRTITTDTAHVVCEELPLTVRHGLLVGGPRPTPHARRTATPTSVVHGIIQGARGGDPMQLLESLTAVPAPLESDSDGVIRLTGTRVRLDSIVTAFQQGSSVEEIVLKFPTLRLTDVYSVITYYLWHRDEVEEYLRCHHLRRSPLCAERGTFPLAGDSSTPAESGGAAS